MEVGFREFTARIVFGWLFLVIALTLILGALPYQLETGSNAIVPWHMLRQIISIAASTSVLITFFLPNRLWSIISLSFLIVFTFCYYNIDGNAFYHYAWFASVAPFCVSGQEFLSRLKASRVIFVLFFMFNVITFKKFELTALPSYSLFLTPYIPWNRIYNWFEDQFEPK
jgi:hypothetical protein